jgi:ribulose-phosphate 3-epimerase
VPNLTIGPPVVKSIRSKLPNVHFDCHLMVTYPRDYIEPLAKIGVSCFTFHYEAEHGGLNEVVFSRMQICELIRSHKMEVGLALRPKTPIDATVEELIKEKKVDKILVMTVEPGFGGQKFILDTMEKVKFLHKNYPGLHIQVDGGIIPENS